MRVLKAFKVLMGIAVALIVALPLLIGWVFTGMALFPAWSEITFSDCPPARQTAWGPSCGNPVLNQVYPVETITYPVRGSFEAKAWVFRARDIPQEAHANHWMYGPDESPDPDATRRTRTHMPAEQARLPLRTVPGTWAVVFLHGGGADRRQGYAYARYFLERGIDVYLPDLGCHGDAGCDNPALSFAQREHRDVISFFDSIEQNYDGWILMGTSVGATSGLVALPELSDVRCAIVENPMHSVKRFILETPAAPELFPEWYRRFLARFLYLRGDFDNRHSPAKSLASMDTNGPSILFIHSQEDSVIPWKHSPQLIDLYPGPSELWLLRSGRHSRLWLQNPALFEKRMDDFLGRCMAR